MLGLETFKNNWKRYVWSIGITFLAGFLTAILAAWQGVTLDSFKDGSIVVLVFGATRMGVKLVFELLLMSITKSVTLKGMGTKS